jgi:hypothetical protein
MIPNCTYGVLVSAKEGVATLIYRKSWPIDWFFPVFEENPQSK